MCFKWDVRGQTRGSSWFWIHFKHLFCMKNIPWVKNGPQKTVKIDDSPPNHRIVGPFKDPKMNENVFCRLATDPHLKIFCSRNICVKCVWCQWWTDWWIHFLKLNVGYFIYYKADLQRTVLWACTSVIILLKMGANELNTNPSATWYITAPWCTSFNRSHQCHPWALLNT